MNETERTRLHKILTESEWTLDDIISEGITRVEDLIRMAKAEEAWQAYEKTRRLNNET